MIVRITKLPSKRYIVPGVPYRERSGSVSDSSTNTPIEFSRPALPPRPHFWEPAWWYVFRFNLTVRRYDPHIEEASYISEKCSLVRLDLICD